MKRVILFVAVILLTFASGVGLDRLTSRIFDNSVPVPAAPAVEPAPVIAETPAPVVAAAPVPTFSPATVLFDFDFEES